MDSEKPEKRQIDKGKGVVDAAGEISKIRVIIHGWNQKQINEPADTQKPEGKKIDGPGHRFSIIKPVGAGETEYP